MLSFEQEYDSDIAPPQAIIKYHTRMYIYVSVYYFIIHLLGDFALDASTMKLREYIVIYTMRRCWRLKRFANGIREGWDCQSRT